MKETQNQRATEPAHLILILCVFASLRQGSLFLFLCASVSLW